MMKSISLLALLFFVTAFNIGCKSEKIDPQLSSLMDEVMAIHDEVMPKTGTINKKRKALKKKLTPMIEDTTQIRNQLLNTILELETAEESMMEWMSEYKSKPSKLEEGVNPMDYYKEEKVKITEVKRKMLQSIENAKVLLDE